MIYDSTGASIFFTNDMFSRTDYLCVLLSGLPKDFFIESLELLMKDEDLRRRSDVLFGRPGDSNASSITTLLDLNGLSSNSSLFSSFYSSDSILSKSNLLIPSFCGELKSIS